MRAYRGGGPSKSKWYIYYPRAIEKFYRYPVLVAQFWSLSACPTKCHYQLWSKLILGVTTWHIPNGCHNIYIITSPRLDI